MELITRRKIENVPHMKKPPFHILLLVFQCPEVKAPVVILKADISGDCNLYDTQHSSSGRYFSKLR